MKVSGFRLSLCITLGIACTYVTGIDQKFAGFPLASLYPIYVKTVPIPFKGIINP